MCRDVLLRAGIITGLLVAGGAPVPAPVPVPVPVLELAGPLPTDDDDTELHRSQEHITSNFSYI